MGIYDRPTGADLQDLMAAAQRHAAYFAAKEAAEREESATRARRSADERHHAITLRILQRRKKEDRREIERRGATQAATRAHRLRVFRADGEGILAKVIGLRPFGGHSRDRSAVSEAARKLIPRSVNRSGEIWRHIERWPLSALSPLAAYEHADIVPFIRAALHSLPPRYERVVRMRFGLGAGSEPMTLAEVAKAFGVSRDRIHQMEAKALRHLRHPCRAKPLRACLETFSAVA